MYNYYRVSKTNSGVYAYGYTDLGDISGDLANICELASNEGVLLVADLETAAEFFDISVDEIQIVND